ncbi:tyrosine recombinase XerS [Alteribacter aurantiacus]|uniref:tyrosine recombinase XerS n=1 Tax=Alteribacter aurantiacus TaxID=254410 RepID=UPI0004219072|nr:tyrosine recombinase XerS [Alteribacter aurantiacus]
MAENLSREKHTQLKKLMELKSTLPWYVEEYLDVKRRRRMSPSTLTQYARDYIRFFDWMSKQQESPSKEMKHLPYSILSSMRKTDAEAYLDFLEIDRGLSDETINRNISSLKSLFKYLTTQTEDEEGECYFYRNVFAKVNLLRPEKDDSQKAEQVATQIFQGNTDKEFLRFLMEEYPLTLSGRSLAHYKNHIIRDFAMISLFLGSGIRVSELVQLTVDDVFVNQNKLAVQRKGNKKSVVLATKSSMDDLHTYLKIRKERYNVPDNQKHVFVSNYAKSCNPLSIRAVQHIVGKYTASFISKMSPHKFRHTFATKYWLSNKDQISLMRQLGHNSVQTTTIYTNLDTRDLEKQMDAIDEYKED